MLVSLRRFKMVLPPFPPHLMIRYQSRHLESTLNQFISFVFNHPPRFELSTMRRRRRRRHWGRGERGRTKEITEESIVEIFFLQWRSLASPSSSLASWLLTILRHSAMLVPLEITLSDYIPTIHVISTTTSLANQPILERGMEIWGACFG